MLKYISKRLLLLPLTLFLILLFNFIVLNLAPGEPSSVVQISPEGSQSSNRGTASSLMDRYLIFREHYGLTLPILFNTWPSTTKETILEKIDHLQAFEKGAATVLAKTYEKDRLYLFDHARFIMPKLLAIMENNSLSPEVRRWATLAFIRGGFVFDGSSDASNRMLISLLPEKKISAENLQKNIDQLKNWYHQVEQQRDYSPNFQEKVKIFFTETRFWRYFSRVLTLDFGTLRNDNTRYVIDEVIKRIPISLTIAGIPLILTFFLCQFFGYWGAYRDGKLDERILDLTLLILFAIPVFVAGPFLIEWVGLKFGIPVYGFSSPQRIYQNLTSWERLKDIGAHIFLPVTAVLYGSFAAQSRLTKHLVQDISHQEFIQTARAKGLSEWTIAWKHIGRNLAIVLVTSLAGSLGVLLGGSLIVETLFEINGFGRFFYEAILNRDYNVILFSSIAGSFLTLLGYLLADISYTLLDPRVHFT